MKTKYDVNFINPFLYAVVHVLTTMAKVEPTPGKPFINKERTARGDVTGVIGITGYSTGTVSVTFEKNAILKIVNNMLYESYTEITKDIADAVGELTNMITGQARAELSKHDIHFKAATPSVVLGRGHSIMHAGDSPILSIPFETPDGGFLVEVSILEDGGDAAKESDKEAGAKESGDGGPAKETGKGDESQASEKDGDAKESREGAPEKAPDKAGGDKESGKG